MNDTLRYEFALNRPDLLAPPVVAALNAWRNPTPIDHVQVVEIDPEVSDTASFCARYQVSPCDTANCIVIEARRGDVSRLAACLVRSDTRADLNGVVRRHLNARRISLAAHDIAVTQTGMEYGSITAIGLPPDWPLLIDTAVVTIPHVIMGGGLRRSKLSVPGNALANLANTEIANIAQDLYE